MQPTIEVSTRVLTGDFVLLCPVCKFEYNHVTSVLVGGRSREDGPVRLIEVTTDGTVREPPKWHEREPSSKRREWITLRGYCEDGHQWSIAFVQHKGWMLVEAVDVGPLEP